MREKTKALTGLKRVVLIAILLRCFLALFGQYHPDILNHLDWGNKLWKYGPADFYEQVFWRVSWPNQPIGSIFLFGLIAKLNDLIFSSLWRLNLKLSFFPSFIFPFLDQKLHIFLVKLPFIASDLGLGFLIYKIVLSLSRDKKKAFWAMIAFLFNPIVIYNSAVWGQTDALVNLLAVFGAWSLFKKRYFLGIFSFLFSLYFKLSLIIWLPIIGLIIWRNKDFKKAVLPLIISLMILIIFAIPFVHHGNVFSWLWYLYTNRVLPRQGNMLSGNAFNFWNLIYGLDLSLSGDLIFLGLPAKIFGLVLTLMVFAFLLFLSLKKKASFANFLFLMLIFAFAAFLFMTNMHERYLYPIFAPLTILVALGSVKRIWLYLLSIIHLLNLYTLWWYPPIKSVKILLEEGDFFLTRVLSAVLILIFVKLIEVFAD